MTSRSKRAATAAESIRDTKTFAPEEFDTMALQVTKKMQSISAATEFDVANEATFAAARSTRF